MPPRAKNAAKTPLCALGFDVLDTDRRKHTHTTMMVDAESLGG